MGAIIVGIILGILVGVIVLGVISINSSSYWSKFLKIIVTITFVIIVAVGGVIGGYCSYNASCEYIEEYTAVKNTIESSLAVDDLTGFERVALVTSASKHNGELGKYKAKCSKWYGFTLTDKILDLEYIDLSGVDD